VGGTTRLVDAGVACGAIEVVGAAWGAAEVGEARDKVAVEGQAV
jgi:hypothetical protein